MSCAVFLHAASGITRYLPACKDFPRNPVSWGGKVPERPIRSCQSWCSRSLDSSQLSCMCIPLGSAWVRAVKGRAWATENRGLQNDSARFKRLTPAHRLKDRDPESNSPRIWAVPTEKSVELVGQEVEIGWGERTPATLLNGAVAGACLCTSTLTPGQLLSPDP